MRYNLPFGLRRIPLPIKTGFLLVSALCTAACGGGGDGAAEASGGGPSLGAQQFEGHPDDFALALERWEHEMQQWGRLHCAALENGAASFDERLAATYYDAQWVFLQMEEYLGGGEWRRCADAAARIYRDGYVRAVDGKVPAYWNFSHGLTKDYLETGDEQSRQAVLLLAANAAYSGAGAALSETEPAAFSREVAYTIMTYLNAERMGEPRNPRLEPLVEQAVGHIDQWFVRRNAAFVRPFMVALTAQALIEYRQAGGSQDVTVPLQRAGDRLWDDLWNEGAQSFNYTDRDTESGGIAPAPDLNLLIAPLYAWMYSVSENPVYRDRADRIFAGGVRQAYLQNPKQFNQNYRWSWAYLAWRQ